jgi:adenosine deaminase
VLLDHLDGGVRPGTVVELAAEGYEGLPSTDEQDLQAWFLAAANSGSLERYGRPSPTPWDHADPRGPRRVAAECAEDLALGQVIYAEVRYAPELHVGGACLPEVVEAVNAGFREGERRAGRRQASAWARC